MTEPAASGSAAHVSTYRTAGVDTAAKMRLLDALRPAVASTHGEAVAAGLGAFAGVLRLPGPASGFLAATTDGVGTKTILARRLGRDAVVGADIVAHCANDVAAVGARPVAFLDYVAMGRLVPEVVAAIVGAIAEACRALGVALLGGETAEMPGVYHDGAYDVAGTMLGLVPEGGLITGAAIQPGDRIVGLASTGLHTNGFSLVRWIVEQAGIPLEAYDPDLGTTAGEALLASHRCYAPGLLALLQETRVHGLAHITGGGLVDNITRILPDRCLARLNRGWPRPPVFAWLARHGRLSEEEMLQTFNLGIGMALVVPAAAARRAIGQFEAAGTPAYEIGGVEAGDRGVEVR